MQRIPSQDQDNSFPKSSPGRQVICLPPGPAFFPPKLMSGESDGGDVGLAPPPPLTNITGHPPPGKSLWSHSGDADQAAPGQFTQFLGSLLSPGTIIFSKASEIKMHRLQTSAEGNNEPG